MSKYELRHFCILITVIVTLLENYMANITKFRTQLNKIIYRT